MTADRLINVLVLITLVQMMVATGLGVAWASFLSVVLDWRLVLRTATANYLLVPAATVGLLLLFAPDPMVAAGFLILAVCPGAPYIPLLTGIAKGNVDIAAGLMTLLAGSSAIVAPLALGPLLWLVTGTEASDLEAAKIVATLLLTQLVPLCIGIAVRQARPEWAGRIRPSAERLSKVLTVVTISMILVARFPLLGEIRPRGLVGMLALLFASWAAGWLLGGRVAATRRACVVTASLRNAGVGLAIASGSFGGTAAVTAVVAYGLVTLFGTLALAIYLGRGVGDPARKNDAPGGTYWADSHTV